MSGVRVKACEECGQRHRTVDSLGDMPRPMNVPSVSFYYGTLGVRRHYGNMYIIHKGANKLLLTRDELKLILSTRKHFLL